MLITSMLKTYRLATIHPLRTINGQSIDVKNVFYVFYSCHVFYVF